MIPKKDPATDSYHLITCKSGDDVLDPNDWEGFIVHVYRPNGNIIARFSKNDIAGYVPVEMVGEKIRILMKAAYTWNHSNEQIYYKVFRQQDDGDYNLKIGPNMATGLKVLMEIGDAEMKRLPDMDSGGSSSSQS